MDNQPKPQQQQIPINLDPQDYYLNNAFLAYDEEQFLFVLQTGFSQRRYLLNPKHAKRFSLLLTAKIKEYEKVHGKLDTSLPGLEAGQEETSETKPLGFSNK